MLSTAQMIGKLFFMVMSRAFSMLDRIQKWPMYPLANKKSASQLHSILCFFKFFFFSMTFNPFKDSGYYSLTGYKVERTTTWAKKTYAETARFYFEGLQNVTQMVPACCRAETGRLGAGVRGFCIKLFIKAYLSLRLPCGTFPSVIWKASPLWCCYKICTQKRDDRCLKAIGCCSSVMVA